MQDQRGNEKDVLTGDNENDLSKVLNSGNVDSFIKDRNLWKKYVIGAK